MKRLSILLCFLAFLGALPSFAFAGTQDNMSGYAWSDTIGWVSFNCTNDSTCGVVDYGVNKNADGTLTGYAWSQSVGWIQFGGLSGFPNGSGTQSSNAILNGNNLQGWIRAVANGNGWDGWISLSGSGYGVTLSGTTYTGYAWGSDVVGWLSFDAAGTNAVKQTSDAAFDVQSGGATLSGNGAVPYGTVPTFTWSLTNMPGGASCSLSKTTAGGTAFTSISGIVANGTTTGSGLTNASYTYQFTCSTGGNTLVTKTVSFTVAPQPPGFSLGSSDIAKIQFLNSGSSDSEQKTIFVSAVGGFSNPVTISITGYPTPPASTTFSYSLGGSAFSSSPAPVVISSPYSSGTTLKIRVSRKITSPYTVTLTGTASGATSATKDIVITPTSFSPLFEEF